VKKVAFGLALLILLPVLVAGAAMGDVQTSTAEPSALKDIPGTYARLYVQAASRFSFSWQLLAAVGKVECDHGRGDCYRPNSAGAMGPMQFLEATWRRYESASEHPPYDVYDARDAIFAAAAKLAADGIATRPRDALFAYNHSEAYVSDVLAWAVRYGWASSDDRAFSAAVLAHPSIELLPEARADIEAGLVDPRVLGALLNLAASHRLGSVGPLVSGHSLYVAGTDRISNHAVGRAVDISVIDGLPVSATNDGARATAEALLALDPPLRPDELGAPWDLPSSSVQTWADAAHAGHLHLGWSGFRE
jgi:hypothetical protein